ncbi:hypothetical protein ABRQ22_17395 [Cellulosimicrobium sp. ES-005]|uniref:Uncharacterized protein n=1 Tax=Cellulosimicrobium sp. ES-005 TaxID=3163031 RepID=A0AAU8FYP6_9MICO
MIRHLPSVMAAVTILSAAALWWARSTFPALVPLWLVITACAFVLTIILARITPGSSDE